MGIRRRVHKVLAWGLFLVVATLVGGGLCAYFYVTDSDNLVALVEQESPRFLPGGRLSLARVRIKPLLGEITLTHATIKRDTGAPVPTLVAMSPWIQLRYDPWAAMTEGKFIPRKVLVAHPLLRLREMRGGGWNIQGLLADPLPIPMGGPTPPVEISNGTVELAGIEEGPGTAVLRDVSIRIPAGSGGIVAFEMTGRGDLLDRVAVEGTFDPRTGRVAITRGDLSRLLLSGALRERLPAVARRGLDEAGLEGGEVDISLARLGYDPDASPRLTYEAAARLRKGAWKCPKLPFPISDVLVDLTARDGIVRIDRGEGKDGSTLLTLSGQFGLDDPKRSPFRVRAEARNLELDRRLRDWTPEKFADLWDVYLPKVGHVPSTSAGKVDVVVTASRGEVDGPVRSVVEASCQDVSMEYVHFKYPLDHVRGTIRIEGKRMEIDMSAPVGGHPLRVRGTVDDPGPDAVANLSFDVESLPVDAALLKALPADVRKVVNEFQPDGSVQGRATVTRKPPLTPQDPPIGQVEFHAWVDLRPGCSITWDGLKYPVRNLLGKLEIHPNQWIFSDMSGVNGQARISARGQVDQIARDKFKVKTHVEARNLPFDQQLREALLRPWQVTWATLNPTGASDIDADIDAEPGRPDHYRVQITPREGAGVKLQFDRPATAGGDGGPTRVEMRMDEVSGRFVFDTAQPIPTEMTDVGFTFQGAPVRFDRGQVDVKDNGQFSLGVTGLEVEGLRLDERLRRQMPPLMAQLARRLDDRKIHKVKGDLGLGWSGKANESAWCRWKDVLIVLLDNKVDLGSDLALDHIQGQIEQVKGFANGTALEVSGLLALDSVSFLGQQLTRLGGRVDVKDGWANITDFEGRLLGGNFGGSLKSSLDATPKYNAGLSVEGIDLQEYAKALPGHQSYRGLVSGWATVAGQGFDPHAIQAQGHVGLSKGELGAVPAVLAPFFKVINSGGKDNRTAFDEAEVSFKTTNGETQLKPVRILGNAFTLHGEGKLDVQGNLNLHLPITLGRDTWRSPIGDVVRRASGQLFSIRVQGPLRSPSFSMDPVPIAGDSVRAISRKDGAEKPEAARR
ncbi:AsmA-like C-terminal region-containing protein [Tundrisphaera sp. TA3]|uniref:AsmA-like C-terminal region-containing protein n=1 Tax=Tundrisphaera sp. TA3 TaxID=3435775 RepID=UPI003EB763AB